jgi:hypothetical protein
MPPKDAKQPSDPERKELRDWVRRYLDAEAQARAGDPGPIVLRRLSNAEYSYTVQDLTGIDLQPARDFPVDGAAGEGFTNTGAALVMSPALLSKYLDAAKEIARHAVLLPDGMRFARGATRRDWTNEILGEIKSFYGRFADDDGRLPLEKYLAATLDERAALAGGSKTLATVAAARGLNAKYLATLWSVLKSDDASPLFGPIRSHWRQAKPNTAASLVADFVRWQNTVSRFQSVGHMKPWVVPADPITTREEMRVKIPAAGGSDVVLYLAAGTAGDGNAGDIVVWQRPRLVTPGRPDLLLRDVRAFSREMSARRQRIFSSAAKCLTAAAEAGATAQQIDVSQLARRHAVDVDALEAWLDYLGIGSHAAIHLDHFTDKMTRSGNYDFVTGWGTSETPLLLANSSNQSVRIPGNMKAHGLVVHPSPTLNAAVGWQSPIAGVLRISAKVTHAHPECGNGVAWSLELRRGGTRQRLAAGTAAGPKTVDVGPIEQVAVQPGDLVSLLVGPRDGNHACDLTDVEFVLSSPHDGREWNLTRDVSADVLAGNPHADRFGNKHVWHFYTESTSSAGRGPVIPAGSLLARWQSAETTAEKQALAKQVQKLLTGRPPATKDNPDAALYRQLASLGGPLFAGARSHTKESATAKKSNTTHRSGQWGLDPGRFGRAPDGSPLDPESLCVKAPSLIAIRLPADLVMDSQLVVGGSLHPKLGEFGSVQLQVSAAKPASLESLRPESAVLVAGPGKTRDHFEKTFADFRRLFPAALCYRRIVPVDEAVTLTLYHREDEALCRLMLNDAERGKLERLWSELHFVSQDALTQVDAFAQLMEYATQDSDPRLFEPYRKPINERAAAFRQLLLDTQPRQLDRLVSFAALAYRHPLSDAESRELRQLYQRLRAEGLSHDEAFRLTLARVFIAPAFLYHLEGAPSGVAARPVTNWELASRLSYFLWSSVPDAPLREVAAAGRLSDPDVLAAQARRMLRDPRVRRLATEFACQWLHIHDFDELNEKSERHYPTFAALRADMYEEAIRLFTEMFQRDESVLAFLNADYTFLNEPLAKHYGIPGVVGPQWRRVNGIKKYERGGILGLSATLAKQSGASRSSPTLRGNWIAEVLLGDRLPRPPKDVPRLPDDESELKGLTVRQIVEKHASDARCAGCHVRIDPFGFALEGFDAIGRRRPGIGTGSAETQTKLQDGTQIAGLDGLREFLLTKQRSAVLRQLSRKLLGYALGRGTQLSDGPLLSDMQKRLEHDDYRFSALIETIVRSPQFREIRGKDVAADEAL